MDVLEVLGRSLEHRDAGLARARERDDGHVGMADDPVPHLAAEAVNEVDDARRHAGLEQQLDEALREHRRVVRGLEDDGVAADERRHDLPRGDRDREVPRRDHADDADRRPDAHVELVRKLGRRRVPEQAAALAGHVVAHVDRFLDVAAGLGEHLPHLARHQVRELGLVLGDERAEPEQDLAALRRRHEAPARRTPPSPPRPHGRRRPRSTAGRRRPARRSRGCGSRRSCSSRRRPRRRRSGSPASRPRSPRAESSPAAYGASMRGNVPGMRARRRSRTSRPSRVVAGASRCPRARRRSMITVTSGFPS